MKKKNSDTPQIEKVKISERFKTLNKKTKIIIGAVGAVIILTIAGGVIYYSNIPEETTVATEFATPKKDVPKKLQEEDLKNVIEMKDSYAVVNSKDVDLTANLDYDKDIVKEVKVEDSKVNYSKEGTYNVTYTVTVDRNALEEKNTEKPSDKENEKTKENTQDMPEQKASPTDSKEKTDGEDKSVDVKEEVKADDSKNNATPDKSETELEENVKDETASTNDSNKELQTEEIVVEKEVTIVTKEEGEKLAGKGETVWTGNGTFLPVKDDKKEPVKTEDKKTEDKKTEDKKTEDKKPEDKKQDDSKTDSTASATENQSPAPTQTPSQNTANSEPAHVHNWVERTHTVYHEATGHNEQVLISAAWTETVQVGEPRVWDCCNVCGADCSTDPWGHMKAHALAGEGGGYHTEYDYSTVSTQQITHDAVYEPCWVQDSAAWTETVSDGWYCTTCGATR